jgi:hypothetical protein
LRVDPAGPFDALTSVSSILNNFATPIIAIIAVVLTVRINNTLNRQTSEQRKNDLEHSKSLATMSIRLEIFKDLKIEYDKMIAYTQKLPYPKNGEFIEEPYLAYRIWDDKLIQYGTFFPETFSSNESTRLQSLLADLQMQPSPVFQRDILTAYDQFIARMAKEITEATIIERQTVIVEREDGTTEEYRFGQ